MLISVVVAVGVFFNEFDVVFVAVFYDDDNVNGDRFCFFFWFW